MAESLFVSGDTTGGSVGADDVAYNLGTKFSVIVPGTITAIRWYAAASESGTHTLRLYNGTTLIGSAYTTTGTGAAWVEYTLTTPVAVAPGATYTVAVTTGADTTPGPRYYVRSAFHTSIIENGGHLRMPVAAGCFIDGAPTSYPSSTYNNSTYFRDVVFEPDATTFPLLENVKTTNFASNTTAHVVNMPATRVTGDLIIVMFSSDGDATVTTPSGWTSLGSTANGIAGRLSVYGRIYQPGDASTVDFVTSAAEAATAQVFRISGWHGNLTDGVKVLTFATATTTTGANPASFSPSFGSGDNLWIAVASDSSTATLSSAPTDYVNVLSTSGGSGTTGAQLHTATRLLTAGTEDVGAFTFSATGSRVYTVIAVAPAVAGGVELTPPTGTISVIGTAPSSTHEKILSTGLVAAAGTTPARSTTLVPDSGLMSAAGAQPAMTKILAPASGTVAAVGNVPTAIIPTQFHVPDGGAANAVGNAPARSLVLAPVAGSVSAAGSAPARTSTLAPASGSVSATGDAPYKTSALAPSTGVVSATGNAPSLSFASTSGLISAIGNAPDLTYIFALETGTISATGEPQQPSLSMRFPVTDTGTVYATGAAPTMVRVLQPSPSSVTAAGSAPTATRVIAPAPGSALASGAQPASSRAVVPSRGAATASGNAPVLTGGTALVLQTGLISAIGNAPELDLPDPAVLTPIQSGIAQAIGAQPSLAFTYCPPSGRGTWIGNQPQIPGKFQSGGACAPPLLGAGLKIIDFVAYLS